MPLGLRPWVKGVHFSWLAFLKQRDRKFWEGVDKRRQKRHPLCVVSKRRYQVTSDPRKVNCRSCLKRMALVACGEQQWRARIINSYLRKK